MRLFLNHCIMGSCLMNKMEKYTKAQSNQMPVIWCCMYAKIFNGSQDFDNGDSEIHNEFRGWKM